MAEFCKECFIRDMLTTKEQNDYHQGKLEIKTTEDDDVEFCESCCEYKPFVIRVVKKKE